jgi:hypothetical protein
MLLVPLAHAIYCIPIDQTESTGVMKSRLVIILLGASAIVSAQDSAPPPGAAEQARVLADASMHAVHHEASLPNFICTQTTRRFEDVNNAGWQPIDTIVERLTYFDHREIYKVLEMNGHPVNIAHDQVRGTSSSGDFASVMRAIFLPQTETEFAWHNWFTLRGERMHVYAYRVPTRPSYEIDLPERSLDFGAAYHGLVFIDVENHFVRRITLHADEIPSSVPIQGVSLTLDYGYTRIGDDDYLLPLQFELQLREGSRLIKNQVDYDNYRKFDTVAVLSYDSRHD